MRISSGPYSFYFDRNTELGIVTPILASFPSGQVFPHLTQFFLEIRDEAKQQDLSDALLRLPASVLIFLRKLRHLRINFRDGGHRELICQHNEDGDISLISVDFDPLKGLRRSEVKYIVSKYLLTSMPNDSKRVGVTESEIVLAFPLSAEGKPVERTQETHAFLPIQDYGFKVSPMIPIILRLTALYFADVIRVVLNSSRLSVDSKQRRHS